MLGRWLRSAGRYVAGIAESSTRRPCPMLPSLSLTTRNAPAGTYGAEATLFAAAGGRTGRSPSRSRQTGSWCRDGCSHATSAPQARLLRDHLDQADNGHCRQRERQDLQHAVILPVRRHSPLWDGTRPGWRTPGLPPCSAGRQSWGLDIVTQATARAGSGFSSLLSALTSSVTRTVASAIRPAPTANATWYPWIEARVAIAPLLPWPA